MFCPDLEGRADPHEWKEQEGFQAGRQVWGEGADMPETGWGRDLRFGGIGFLKVMVKAGCCQPPQPAEVMASEAAYGGFGKNDEGIAEALRTRLEFFLRPLVSQPGV